MSTYCVRSTDTRTRICEKTKQEMRVPLGEKETTEAKRGNVGKNASKKIFGKVAVPGVGFGRQRSRFLNTAMALCFLFEVFVFRVTSYVLIIDTARGGTEGSGEEISASNVNNFRFSALPEGRAALRLPRPHVRRGVNGCGDQYVIVCFFIFLSRFFQCFMCSGIKINAESFCSYTSLW